MTSAPIPDDAPLLPPEESPMDIHKPRPMHNFRDFAKEIGTITIGILIALALEALVVEYQHRQLVDHARSDMRMEIASNRKLLAGTLNSGKTVLPALDKLIDYVRARAAHKSPEDPGVTITTDFSTMSTSAWESTVSTQALAYMPYSDAQTLTRAYAGARGFNDFETQVEREWFELAAMPDTNDISPEDAKAALHALSLNRALMSALVNAGSQAIKSQDQALALLQK
jgi:hypothetical protein